MGHFVCKCEAVIALKTGVEPYLGALVDESFLNQGIIQVWDGLDGLASKPPWISDRDAQLDHLLAELDNHSRNTIECETCGRLWLQNKAADRYEAYVKED